MNRRQRRWLTLVLLVAGTVWLGYRWGLTHLYPLQYRQLVLHYSRENGLDPWLVAAVVNVESRWRPRVVSSKGARGLMQVMPTTGEWVAAQMKVPGFHPDQLLEPDMNLRLGTWYLAWLLREFQGNQAVALAAYNSGDGPVRRWLAENRWTGDAHTAWQIPFPETRAYVVKVLAHRQRYGQMYRLPDVADPSEGRVPGALPRPGGGG